MNPLRVTTIQYDIQWHAPQANRNRVGEMLAEIGETDVVILPEMFTTGFTMAARDHAELMDGHTVRWMTEMAGTWKCCMTGSSIIEVSGRYYNRLMWVYPDGKILHYDKRHLFTLADEQKQYEKGHRKLILSYKGWRICPMICYDLRFPVWSRCTDDYDMLIYVANWPTKRSNAWCTLLQARAIENQAFTIGVNRVGTDGNGHQYRGETMVIDPGDLGVLYLISDLEEIKTHELHLDRINEVRSRHPFLKDRDEFVISSDH